jgi:chromosome segregation ATPase
LELIAFQAAPPIQREGLPYWIFWFMLFIIMLLFVFIFLRDKRLRMRISTFLAGARRRSILIKLKYQLKKEKQKQAALVKKLGEKAWGEDIHVQGSEVTRGHLKELFEKRDAGQVEWKNAFAELEKFHKRLEETIGLYQKKVEEQIVQRKPQDELMRRKKEEEKALKKVPEKDREIERQVEEARAEREETRERIEEIDDAIKETEAEGRSKRRDIEKEIHYWEKKKEKIQDKIKENEAQQQEHYYSLGRVFEEQRVNSPALAELYLEIDGVNQRITTLQHRIETLTGG